jgi:hypothetical protein
VDLVLFEDCVLCTVLEVGEDLGHGGRRTRRRPGWGRL